jgi:hypothetical protein
MKSTLKSLFHRISLRSVKRSECNDYVGFNNNSTFSIATEPAGGLQLPRDPKKVKKARHHADPGPMPDANDSCSEVRYWLYTVLTSAKAGCADKYPQWILETC